MHANNSVGAGPPANKDIDHIHLGAWVLLMSDSDTQVFGPLEAIQRSDLGTLQKSCRLLEWHLDSYLPLWYAVLYERIDVLEWLVRVRPKDLHKDLHKQRAMAWGFACQLGSLKVVQWLYADRSVQAAGQGLISASQNDHVHVVAWLCAAMSPSTKVMHSAAVLAAVWAHQHHTLEWWCAHPGVDPLQVLADIRVWQRPLEAVVLDILSAAARARRRWSGLRATWFCAAAAAGAAGAAGAAAVPAAETIWEN